MDGDWLALEGVLLNEWEHDAVFIEQVNGTHYAALIN